MAEKCTTGFMFRPMQQNNTGPIERKLHEVQHMNIIAMMWNICRAIDNELAKLQRKASYND